MAIIHVRIPILGMRRNEFFVCENDGAIASSFFLPFLCRLLSMLSMLFFLDKNAVKNCRV